MTKPDTRHRLLHSPLNYIGNLTTRHAHPTPSLTLDQTGKSELLHSCLERTGPGRITHHRLVLLSDGGGSELLHSPLNRTSNLPTC